MTSKPMPSVELNDLRGMDDVERLLEEVQATKQPWRLYKDGKPLAELHPVPSVRRKRKTERPMRKDDPLWGLVGFAVNAPPTDSSRKLELLGEAHPQSDKRSGPAFTHDDTGRQ